MCHYKTCRCHLLDHGLLEINDHVTRMTINTTGVKIQHTAVLHHYSDHDALQANDHVTVSHL